VGLLGPIAANDEITTRGGDHQRGYLAGSETAKFKRL